MKNINVPMNILTNYCRRRKLMNHLFSFPAQITNTKKLKLLNQISIYISVFEFFSQ